MAHRYLMGTIPTHVTQGSQDITLGPKPKKTTIVVVTKPHPVNQDFKKKRENKHLSLNHSKNTLEPSNKTKKQKMTIAG